MLRDFHHARFAVNQDRQRLVDLGQAAAVKLHVDDRPDDLGYSAF